MPKITAHRGPTYAGYVDVTPADVAEPQWQPVADLPTARTTPPPAPEPVARRRGRTRKDNG